MTEELTPYANSVFEQPWWLNTVASCQWEEKVYIGKKGDIEGRLAYVHDRNKVFMPPYTQTLGMWMSDNVKSDYGLLKECIYELFREINEYKSVNICLSPENEYVLPFLWMNYALEPRFTYRITDLSDLDKLYASFNKTAKKNIKSARNKVTLEYDTDMGILSELLNKTFETQHRKNPMNMEMVTAIVNTCNARGNGQYIDAKDKDGNIHSCAYFVYDEKSFYYLFGASDPQFRSSGAQSLILWEAIQMASTRSQVIDFEGSMIEGIENFFRQFGGVCSTYYSIRNNGIIGDALHMLKPRVKKLLKYKV